MVSLQLDNFVTSETKKVNKQFCNYKKAIHSCKTITELIFGHHQI